MGLKFMLLLEWNSYSYGNEVSKVIGIKLPNLYTLQNYRNKVRESYMVTEAREVIILNFDEIKKWSFERYKSKVCKVIEMEFTKLKEWSLQSRRDKISNLRS